MNVPAFRASSGMVFELIDALPISGAGKVLKRDLRAKSWDGAQRGVN